MRHIAPLSLALLFAFAAPLRADQPSGVWSYPPKLPGAKVETYKRVGDLELKAYIFQPDRSENPAPRTAVLFFFGGGWRAGTPGQFYPHCQHLAARGAVAISCDYRVQSRHDATPRQCLADAKSAIRWVRANAERLGVDPERIVASGGSAGGHLAAATALIDEFDEPSEDASIPSAPNALVLFNPAVMLAPLEGKNLLGEEKTKDLRKRMGGDPRPLSPIHHVRGGLPPTLILHGTADEAVPFPTVELFTRLMRGEGNDCRLVAYPDQPHGFFNVGRGGSDEKQRRALKNYRDTLRQMDEFLVDHGLLEAS